MDFQIKAISRGPLRCEAIVGLIITPNIALQSRVVNVAIMLDLRTKQFKTQFVFD